MYQIATRRAFVILTEYNVCEKQKESAWEKDTRDQHRWAGDERKKKMKAVKVRRNEAVATMSSASICEPGLCSKSSGSVGHY